MLLKCCLTCNFFILDKLYSNTYGTCFYAVNLYDMPFTYDSGAEVNPYAWHNACDYYEEDKNSVNGYYK